MSKDKIYERDVLLSAFSERLQQAINASSFAKQGQGVLSAQLGVSRQALRKWLNGKTLPSLYMYSLIIIYSIRIILTP